MLKIVLKRYLWDHHNKDQDIRSISICCFNMQQDLKNKSFDVNSDHLWIDQKIINFCQYCGSTIKVIREK